MLANQYVIHDGAVFQVQNIQAPPVGHMPEPRRSTYTLVPLGGGVPIVRVNPTIRLVPMCTLCGTAAGSACWGREDGQYVRPATCTDTDAALARRAGITPVVHTVNVESDGIGNGVMRAWCPCGFQGGWNTTDGAQADAQAHAN